MRAGFYLVTFGLFGFAVHSICAKAIDTVLDRIDEHPVATKSRKARGVDPREETVDWTLPETQTDLPAATESSDESQPWFSEDETFAVVQRKLRVGGKSHEETTDGTHNDIPAATKSSEQSGPWFTEDETFALVHQSLKIGRQSRGVDPREETIDWTLPETQTDPPAATDSSEESRPWFSEEETFAVFARTKRNGIFGTNADVLSRSSDLAWVEQGNNGNAPNNGLNWPSHGVNTNTDHDSSKVVPSPNNEARETVLDSHDDTKEMQNAGAERENVPSPFLLPPKIDNRAAEDTVSAFPESLTSGEVDDDGKAANDNAVLQRHNPGADANGSGNKVNATADDDSSRIVFPPSDEVQPTVFDFYNNMKEMQKAGLDRGNAVTGLLGPPKNGTHGSANDEDTNFRISEPATSGHGNKNGNAQANAKASDTNVNELANSLKAKADDGSDRIVFPPSEEVQDTVFDFYNNMKEMQKAGLDRGNAVTGLLGPPEKGGEASTIKPRK